MNILFIGGTRFVGRAMAQEALARGHAVDVFHRGRTGADALPGARHLVGDRNADLSALNDGRWDAVIDVCAYRPNEVQALSEALGGRIGRYVLVSSISVYDENNSADADESAPRADATALRTQDLRSVPIDAANYGPLKALCEDEAMARHGAACLIVRPTYVFGPHDPTERFPEWVRRIAAGGLVDAPEPRNEPFQYIDARDLASFTIDAIERRLGGAFNAAGPGGGFSFGDMLDTVVRSVAPAGTTLNWLSIEAAKAAQQAFPMWGEGGYSGLSAVSTAAARAQGLRYRPLEQTARDVLAWLRETGKA